MGLSNLYLAYPTAVLIGLVHGSDPGHGWVLSVLYSGRVGGGLRGALFFTTILAAGHFVSAVAVVAAVWIVGSAASEYLVYLKIAAGALLLALASKSLFESVKGGVIHDRGDVEPGERRFAGAREAFKYALILGFAHEEEIALSAIVLAGADPLLLSLAYGAAVYASMMAWTMVTTLAVSRVERLKVALHSVSHLLTPIMLALIGAFILWEAVGDLVV